MRARAWTRPFATNAVVLVSLLHFDPQGKYDEAEPLYHEALAIDRKVLPDGHPDIATDLNNLALLLKAQGKYSEAEPLCRESLGIRKTVWPSGHPSTTAALSNLAELLGAQVGFSVGKFVCGEPVADLTLPPYGEGHRASLTRRSRCSGSYSAA